MHAPAVGDVLAGKYKLVRVVGRGGMGVVFEATQLDLARSVAVKVLSLGVADAAALGRFQREVSILARISHPHIVPVFDFGGGGDADDDTPPFLAMEMLKGRTLYELTVDEGRLAPARAARIVMQLLEALAAAHAQGILHRDVKPGNVFCVETHLAGDFVKLLDFGVAKDLGASRPLTVAGNLVGTLSYLAPELLAGEAATYQTDVYAAGVSLYFALAGKSPFARTSPSDMADAIRKGDATPIERLRHDTPPAIAAVVARAIAVAPAARFESVGAMHAALAASLEAAAPRAGRVETTDAVHGGAATLPRPSEGPTAVVAPGDASPAVGAPPPTPPLPRIEASPSHLPLWLATGAAFIGVGALVFALAMRHRTSSDSSDTPAASAPSSVVPSPSTTAAPSVVPVATSAVPSVATSATSAAVRELTYCGTKVYRSMVDAHNCSALDLPTYNTALDALPIAKCFAASTREPPLHQHPEYRLHIVGGAVTGVDATDGSPQLDACMGKQLRSVPIPGAAPSDTCTIRVGYSAVCPAFTPNDRAACH